MSLLDLFGKDANFFGGRTSEQRARGAGQIAYESIPGISEAVTFRDIKSELSKDNPNWYAIGLLGGAGVLGLIPFIGDIAGSAIRQGVKARNAVNPSSGVLDEFAKDQYGNKLGINVRSDTKEGLSYSDLILDGKKTYETRDSDSLRKYVGKRVGIVKTGEGDASAIGSVIIGEPEIVGVEQFRKLEKKHLVPKGSDFDIKEKKYLYPLIEPQRFDAPIQVGKGIVSRKMLTASQKQAQDILDLLKSGKANEVTDQMLANADQKYLFENYDLPMDTQSRLERAKGMGLLDDSFHGTTSAKTAQDGIKKPGGRLFSSSSPEVANTYGDNIYPLKIRKQDSSMTLDAKGRNWSRIPDPFDEMYSPDKTNFSVDTLTTLPSLSTDIDMSGGKSLTVKNVVDAGAFHTGNPKSYKPSTVTVSHMKNNPLVRSRFARFDPRLKHLKNLSAGFIPIGLLPFLMNEEQQ